MKNKVLIIAEAGVNHNGDLNRAFQLVDVAAAAGADYVKFQTFKAEDLVTKNARTAEYQRNNMGDAVTNQYEMLKALELSVEDHHKIIAYCKTKGIGFFSTAFDLDSLFFLRSLKLGLWKVPSGEITNLPYLEAIGSFNERTILSTGMATMSEVGDAVRVLTQSGLAKENLTILHCNTEYPTPFVDVNLRAMVTMGSTFGVPAGYSDHTLGIEVPIAAVALGALVIEKHFTLDRALPGPDHKASLEPMELKAMVTAVRNIEDALGLSDKIVSPSERKNISVARKSIVARSFIKKGEVFTAENLITRRPGDGLSPMKWHDVLGGVAPRDFDVNEKIELP